MERRGIRQLGEGLGAQVEIDPSVESRGRVTSAAVVSERTIQAEQLREGREFLAVPEDAADSVKKRWGDVATRTDQMASRLRFLGNRPNPPSEGRFIENENGAIYKIAADAVLPDGGYWFEHNDRSLRYVDPAALWRAVREFEERGGLAPWEIEPPRRKRPWED